VGFVVLVAARRPFYVDLEARQPLRQGLLPIRPLRPGVRRLADEGSSKAHAERPRPKAIAGAGRGVVGLTERTETVEAATPEVVRLVGGVVDKDEDVGL